MRAYELGQTLYTYKRWFIFQSLYVIATSATKRGQTKKKDVKASLVKSSGTDSYFTDRQTILMRSPPQKKVSCQNTWLHFGRDALDCHLAQYCMEQICAFHMHFFILCTA